MTWMFIPVAFVWQQTSCNPHALDIPWYVHSYTFNCIYIYILYIYYIYTIYIYSIYIYIYMSLILQLLPEFAFQPPFSNYVKFPCYPFQAKPPSRMHQLGRRRGTDGANIHVPTGGIIPELREVAGWLDTSLGKCQKVTSLVGFLGIFEDFLGLPEKYIWINSW